MKPEDLVGRRIRFLPHGYRNGYSTVHALPAGLEAVITKVEGNGQGSPAVTFRTDKGLDWQYCKCNVDFEVIDDGEIPYSWRV